MDALSSGPAKKAPLGIAFAHLGAGPVGLCRVQFQIRRNMGTLFGAKPVIIAGGTYLPRSTSALEA
jgi:hypothetical protein